MLRKWTFLYICDRSRGSPGFLRGFSGVLPEFFRASPGSSGIPPAFSVVSPAFSGVSACSSGLVPRRQHGAFPEKPRRSYLLRVSPGLSGVSPGCIGDFSGLLRVPAGFPPGFSVIVPYCLRVGGRWPGGGGHASGRHLRWIWFDFNRTSSPDGRAGPRPVPE